MKIFAGLGRVREYFLEIPLPEAVFQVTSRYFSGLRIVPRERKAGGHFLSRLPAGAVRPSFDKPNLGDAPALEAAIKDGMKKLGLSQGSAALLLPELSAKVFVLSLDSVPASPKEREAIIRWRIGKLLPSLPEDARLAFRRSAEGEGERILAAVSRTSVIQEYEGLLAGCGLAAGNVSPPFLNLVGLLPAAPDGDVMAVDVEDDSLSLAALAGSDIVLYRQKPFTPDASPGAGLGAGIKGLATEIENTLHYLEDREKRTIRTLWIRSGLVGTGGNLAAELRKVLPLTVREAGSLVPLDAGDRDKDLLAPLYGHLA
jgi:hypothetical protein